MKVIFTASLLTLALGIVAQITLPDNGPLFLQDEVAVFRVILDQDSLDQMLDSDNWYSNHEYPATFIYESSLGTDTVDLVGLRLRGNTSREAGKKSFKISLNSFIPGQHFQGVEKLNLNGHQNDPSLMRTKICWDTFRNAGVLGCRTSFVAVTGGSGRDDACVGRQHPISVEGGLSGMDAYAGELRATATARTCRRPRVTRKMNLPPSTDARHQCDKLKPRHAM